MIEQGQGQAQGCASGSAGLAAFPPAARTHRQVCRLASRRSKLPVRPPDAHLGRLRLARRVHREAEGAAAARACAARRLGAAAGAHCTQRHAHGAGGGGDGVGGGVACRAGEWMRGSGVDSEGHHWERTGGQHPHLRSQHVRVPSWLPCCAAPAQHKGGAAGRAPDWNHTRPDSVSGCGRSSATPQEAPVTAVASPHPAAAAARRSAATKCTPPSVR